MRSTIAALSCFCLVAINGCAPPRFAMDGIPGEAKAILLNAEEVELFSLDPEKKIDEKTERFRGVGYAVLGKVKLTSPEQIEEVLAALDKGLKGSGPDTSKCDLVPRHVISASRGGRIVDVVICFQCNQVITYLGDDAKTPVRTISRECRPTLNAILTKAGIPLAKERN